MPRVNRRRPNNIASGVASLSKRQFFSKMEADFVAVSKKSDWSV